MKDERLDISKETSRTKSQKELLDKLITDYDYSICQADMTLHIQWIHRAFGRVEMMFTCYKNKMNPEVVKAMEGMIKIYKEEREKLMFETKPYPEANDWKFFHKLNESVKMMFDIVNSEINK